MPFRAASIVTLAKFPSAVTNPPTDAIDGLTAQRSSIISTAQVFLIKIQDNKNQKSKHIEAFHNIDKLFFLFIIYKMGGCSWQGKAQKEAELGGKIIPMKEGRAGINITGNQ